MASSPPTDPSSADRAAGFTYLWAVTKGGVPFALTGVNLSGPTLGFTPAEPGAYAVTLTVADKDGGRVTATKAITVTSGFGFLLLPGGRLIVSGGDGDDKVHVSPGGGAPTSRSS